MARASIVLGLGGTGLWVLTHLKKDLMEANNGIMPANVQLLGVDTQCLDVQSLRAGTNVEDDERIATLTDAQVDKVRLNKTSEFFQIGAPLYNFVLNIHGQDPRSEEYLWLDTDFLINAGPNICDTTRGAGAYRQLGRLSLFGKVELFYNKLLQLISQKSYAIQNKMMTYGGGSQPEHLEIIIVNSLAGGTGAGIFLDVAWLVRAVARSLNFNNYQLSGYFVMPTAWEQAGPSTDKRLRSYAAWQELDRFMLPPIDPSYPSRIPYKPDANPPIVGINDRRIFDSAFIIDPDRLSGPNLMPLKPEEAIYPVVAEAISALLDDELGQMISLDNANNNLRLISLPSWVHYNSFGAFTFKTPERFSKQQIRDEYRLAVLEQLIAPIFGPTGEVIDIKKDCNTEAPSLKVEEGAKAFLISKDHNNISNNLLLPEIQNVCSKGEYLNKYVIEEAKSIIERSGATFNALTSQENDVDLQIKLDQLINQNLLHVIIPSGDRENATPTDIRQEVLNAIDAYDVEWFGQRGYISDPRNPFLQFQTRITEGSKVRLLKEVGQALVRNFKILLKEFSETQLNGIDSEPIKAKRGKLGYLLGVYEELDRNFTTYLKYLNLLYKKISESFARAKFIEELDTARVSYSLDTEKNSIFTFLDKNARAPEKKLLETANHLFQYYLAESILNVLAETVQSMQRFTLESKKKLDEWVKVLAVGRPDGDPNLSFTSLYNYSWELLRAETNDLRAEIRRGNPDFETNRELKGVQQMLNLQVANEHYQSNDRLAAFSERDRKPAPYLPTEELQNGLDAFVWEIGQAKDGSALEFSLYIKDVYDNFRILLNSQTNDAVRENYTVLNHILNIRFDEIMANVPQNQELGKPISKILEETFQDTQDFATQLKMLSKPLYRGYLGAGIMYQQNSMFMRLNGSKNPQYFVNLENNLREQFIGPMETINSFNAEGNFITTSDPYKFTFLQYHNLIPSFEFSLRRDLERLFRDTTDQPNQIVSPSIHYAFNAERKAHELALSRSKLNLVDFRSFEPEIVGMLENPEKTELFFLAFAQGLLVYQEGRENANTTLVLLGKDDVNDVYLFDRDETQMPFERRLTVYEAIHYWLIGKDDRPHMGNINRIDWHKLHEIIQTVEMGQGENDVIAAYHKQMDGDDPESLVSIIRAQANRRKDAVLAQNQRFYQEKVFDDLIDLARVIYTERIQSLEKKSKGTGTIGAVDR